MGKLIHAIGFTVAALGVGVGILGMKTGCGPPGGYITYPDSGATLEGTISYGGQLVAGAMVIARAEGSDGAPVIGWMGDDGHYHLGNMPIGEVQIGVNTGAAKGQMMAKAMSESQGKAKKAPKVTDIPSKFGDPAKSGIKTTVKKGPNTFNIAIAKE